MFEFFPFPLEYYSKIILIFLYGVSLINIFNILSCSNFLKQLINYLTEPVTWLKAFWSFVLMEIFFRFAPRFRLSKIDYFTMNGTFFLKPGLLASAIGAIMFYSGAVFWVSLYKTLKEKINSSTFFLPLKFGTFLFLFASFFVMPVSGIVNLQMRRGILKKPGILGLKLDGWKTPVTNLLAHILFAYVIDSLETSREQGK